MMHGCTVYKERAETAAVSCGTSHVSAVSTPLRWIFQNALWNLVTHVESHASTVSLLESGKQRYIQAISNNNMSHVTLNEIQFLSFVVCRKPTGLRLRPWTGLRPWTTRCVYFTRFPNTCTESFHVQCMDDRPLVSAWSHFENRIANWNMQRTNYQGILL